MKLRALLAQVEADRTLITTLPVWLREELHLLALRKALSDEWERKAA